MENCSTSFDIIDVSAEETKAGQKVGLFEGYAAAYNNVDSYGDIIKPGAFSKAKAGSVRMLYAHDMRKPIGIWKTMKDTKKGLYVQGELTLGVKNADEAYLMLKHGSIKSMSVGFNLPEDGFSWKKKNGRTIREITKAKLMEVSVVTIPANDKAKVTSVKSKDGFDRFFIRDFENLLQEKGWSKREAREISHIGFKEFVKKRGSDQEFDLVKSELEDLGQVSKNGDSSGELLNAMSEFNAFLEKRA